MSQDPAQAYEDGREDERDKISEVLFTFLKIRGQIDAGIETDYSEAFDMLERYIAEAQ